MTPTNQEADVQAQTLRRLLTTVAQSLSLSLSLSTSQLAAAATGPGANAASSVQAPAKAVAARKAAPVQHVDLNNASKAQLRTLSGIGDAEADLIIASRPYNSKADIVTKAGLPAGLYVAIRRQIYVGKLSKAKAKA